MKKPFFSVIIPTHNGAEHIRKAMDSVKRQRFDDYEMIIVCDACTDGTEQIAMEYTPNVLSVDYHRDGLARNKGLDAATGEWILFLDDDDWFLHEYVFSMLHDTVGKHGEDMLDFAFIWKDKGYMEPKPERPYVMAWCRCWKRALIGNARFGNMEYHADVYFYHRMMKKKPNIVFWNMPMYYYNYMREGSLTDMKRKGIISMQNPVFHVTEKGENACE